MSRRSLSWSLLPALAAVLAGCPPEETTDCGEFDEIFVYEDGDGDGYGSENPIGWVCEIPPGATDDASDCDDTSERIHPGAPEDCDGLDNDCNQQVDEGNPFVPYYPDRDGDGYGVDLDAELACKAPGPDFVRQGGDCDDDNDGIYPDDTIEVCNDGVDDDCDGQADDLDQSVDVETMTRWYFDGDGDGYGTQDESLQAYFCEPPTGQPVVDVGGDCDDGRRAVRPSAEEVCNDGRDDDCDGLADDEDPSIDPSSQVQFFEDADGDGYGNPLRVRLACVPTPGIGVDNADDCDDTNPDANIPQDWYADTDGDGAGDGPVQVANACLDPGGGLVPEQNGVDCEPLDASIYPLMLEDCFDGIDQNCDAAIDCADRDCFSEPTCVPPCADDVIAPASLPFATSGSTVGAGDDEQPTTCSFAGGAPDLQFWFTPPVSGVVTIDMIGSSYDTTLYVLDGCGGREIACNDDFWGLQSQVDVRVTAGVPVLVVVDGYSAGSGNFNLNFN